MQGGTDSDILWTHQMLRIKSVGEPFTSPRLAFKGTAALARADAMGLLEERDQGLTLDATVFGWLAARLRKAGIGGAIVPTLTAVTKEPALFERCLDQLNDALEASPAPSTEWSRLLRTLDRELLAGLLGISEASVRRYAGTTRETPDEVAARLHWLALIVGDLAGGYNEIGIRQWFERKRTQPRSKTPASARPPPTAASQSWARPIPASIVTSPPSATSSGRSFRSRAPVMSGIRCGAAAARSSSFSSGVRASTAQLRVSSIARRRSVSNDTFTSITRSKDESALFAFAGMCYNPRPQPEPAPSVGPRSAG